MNLKAKLDEIKSKMEAVGFQYEDLGPLVAQSKKELEYKFTHPELERKLAEMGISMRAKKFYLKQISEEDLSIIGISNSQTKLKDLPELFPSPNATDSYKGKGHPVWINKEYEHQLDALLEAIGKFVKTPDH